MIFIFSTITLPSQETFLASIPSTPPRTTRRYKNCAGADVYEIGPECESHSDQVSRLRLWLDIQTSCTCCTARRRALNSVDSLHRNIPQTPASVRPVASLHKLVYVARPPRLEQRKGRQLVQEWSLRLF